MNKGVEKFKILMLCDLYLSDLNYQENLLSKYYLKKDFNVVIITSNYESIFDYQQNNYESKPSKVFYEKGVKIYRLPYRINFLNKIKSLKGVFKILKAEQPDLIFLHGISLNIKDATNYKLKSDNSSKVIFDFHGDLSNSGKNWISKNILHKIIFRIILNSKIRHLDKIFSITPSSTRFLNKIYKIPINKISLLPLGADTDQISIVKKSNKRNEIRKKFKINGGDLVIFTGGKLTPDKHTDILIKAINKLSNPNIHLIIIGDFSSKDISYKERLLRLSKDKVNIHFGGWINGNEIYNYMIASDIAVFPANQSILWQQCICSGLPLIVGLIPDQNINYINKYNSIDSIDFKDLNEDVLMKSISLYLEKSYLNIKKLAAEKTSYEILDYNKIIQKTL